MSLPPPDHLHTLKEICDLFEEAERAIKEVEDTGAELVVPAVNQLRYTGNHLIRYLSNTSDTEELTDAAKHCKRATYDAYEAAILYQLMEYNKFKDDYRNTIVTDIVPDYHDIVLKIESARKFARGNNKSKTRGEFYQAAREHLTAITKNTNKLNICREELNKKIAREKRYFLFKLLGAAGAIATIAGVVVKILLH